MSCHFKPAWKVGFRRRIAQRFPFGPPKTWRLPDSPKDQLRLVVPVEESFWKGQRHGHGGAGKTPKTGQFRSPPSKVFTQVQYQVVVRARGDGAWTLNADYGTAWRSSRITQLTMVDYRKKHRQNSHLINHYPTSEGASEVSERANEWAVRANERTDERVAQHFSLYSWLLSTIVYSFSREKDKRKDGRLKMLNGTEAGSDFLFFASLNRPRWRTFQMEDSNPFRLPFHSRFSTVLRRRLLPLLLNTLSQIPASFNSLVPF